MSFSIKTSFYVNEVSVELHPMDLGSDKAKLTILLYHSKTDVTKYIHLKRTL